MSHQYLPFLSIRYVRPPMMHLMQGTVVRTKNTENITDLRLRGQPMDPSFSGERSIRKSAGDLSYTPPDEDQSSRYKVT